MTQDVAARESMLCRSLAPSQTNVMWDTSAYSNLDRMKRLTPAGSTSEQLACTTYSASEVIHDVHQ